MLKKINRNCRKISFINFQIFKHYAVVVGYNFLQKGPTICFAYRKPPTPNFPNPHNNDDDEKDDDDDDDKDVMARGFSVFEPQRLLPMSKLK